MASGEFLQQHRPTGTLRRLDVCGEGCALADRKNDLFAPRRDVPRREEGIGGRLVSERPDATLMARGQHIQPRGEETVQPATIGPQILFHRLDGVPERFLLLPCSRFLQERDDLAAVEFGEMTIARHPTQDRHQIAAATCLSGKHVPLRQPDLDA